MMKTLLKFLLTYLYNFLPLISIKNKGQHLCVGKRLKVQGGNGISIKNDVRIGCDARLACFLQKNQLGSINIDDRCYICDHFTILSASSVKIMHDTLIASYVSIIAENHGIDPTCGVRYGEQELTGAGITIENNCWIGEKSIILQGVTIGQWSIVGAGSVVTKNVPPFSIVAGNPAKIIKTFDFSCKCWKIPNI